jgi:hypothetical protein
MARWVVVSSGEGSSSLQGCPGSVATETHSEPGVRCSSPVNGVND